MITVAPKVGPKSVRGGGGAFQGRPGVKVRSRIISRGKEQVAWQIASPPGR